MARIKGLKDISFATLTKDDKTGYAYDSVKKYERSISAKITPKANSENEYSDDDIEEVIDQFDSIDVEIELNQLSTSTRAFLQGSKMINGVLVESKDDIAPYTAMIFKAKKSNGEYRYVCLFKGKFTLSADNYETEGDKIKTQTATLKATFMAREFDGMYRMMADSDDTGIVQADLEKWFTAVPSAPISNVTTITVSDSNIVTNISSGSLTIKTGSKVSDLENAITVDQGNGTFTIYTDNTKASIPVGTSIITASMVVVATAQDRQTTATYTITLA